MLQANEKMKSLLHTLGEHKRRRALLLGFSHAPTEFINALVASQARDLRTIHAMQNSSYVAGAPRRSEVFREKWVDDAAMRYWQSKITAQRHAQQASQAARQAQMRPQGVAQLQNGGIGAGSIPPGYLPSTDMLVQGPGRLQGISTPVQLQHGTAPSRPLAEPRSLPQALPEVQAVAEDPTLRPSAEIVMVTTQ